MQAGSVREVLPGKKVVQAGLQGVSGLHTARGWQHSTGHPTTTALGQPRRLQEQHAAGRWLGRQLVRQHDTEVGA